MITFEAKVNKSIRGQGMIQHVELRAIAGKKVKVTVEEVK